MLPDNNDMRPNERLKRIQTMTNLALTLTIIQIYSTLVDGNTQNIQKISATNSNSHQTSDAQTIPKNLFIDQLLAASSLVGASSEPANHPFQLQNLLKNQQQYQNNNNTSKQVLREQTNAPQINPNENGTNVPRRAVVSISSLTDNSSNNNIANNSSLTQRQQQPASFVSLNLSRHNLNVSSVRQKWRHMERSLGESLYQLARNLKQTLDEIAPPSISSACRVSLLEFIEALKEQKLWANKIIDASAKLPSGLLEGTLTELGNFDQCLAINYFQQQQQQQQQSQQTQSKYMQQSPNIKGQYCSIQIKPYLTLRPRLHTVCQRLPQLSASNNQTNWRLLSQQSHQFHYVGLRLGICTPNKCSKLDIQQILSSYLAKYELLGQVKSCQTAAAATTFDEFSSTKEVAGLDFVQQCIVSTFVVLLALVSIGTLLDYLLQVKQSKAKITNVSSNNNNDDNNKKIEFQLKSSRHKPSPKRRLKASVSSEFQTDCKVLPVGNTAQHCGKASNGGAKRWQYQVYRGAFPRCALHDIQGKRQQAGDEICELGSFDCSDECESDLKLQKNPLVAHLMPLDRKGCDMPLTDVSNHASDDNGSEEAWITRMERNEFDDCNSTTNRILYDEGDSSGKRVISAVQNQPVTFFGILGSFLVCFSLRKNLKVIGKHANGKGIRAENGANDMGDIKVIHGLRTLTMIWIIFGHTIGLVSPEMMNNLFSLAQTSCSSRFLQALLNATLAVNTFFMISGLVTVLSFARKCTSVLPLINGFKTGTTSTTVRAKVIADGKQIETRRTQKQQQDNNYHSELEVSSTDSSSIISSLSSLASSNKCINARGLSSSARTSCSARRSLPNSYGKGKESKTTNRKEPSSITSSPSSFIWPGDFKPLIWLIMRYLRLTPAYAAIIGISVVLPALGSGPFWQESINQMGTTCRRNWWINLTYLNNFIETDKLCLIHSWYLSNDWQFFSITLILFGIFYKSKRVALLLVISLIISTSAATFAVTVANDFPPTIVTTSPAIAERWLFIHTLYYKPWPHLSSYLIGLLTGYLIVIKDRIFISETWRILIWLLFTLVALTLLNSIYPWNMGIQVEPLLAGLHSATFRTLWATCCGWLIFALVTKPQNPLAKFLSWQGFQITSRLTYCAYLVHPLIIYYHFGTLRERLDSSIYGQFHRFMATLGLSYLFALFLSLIVESPSIQLQRFLSNFGSSSSTNMKNDHVCEDYDEDHDEFMVGASKRTNSATATTTTTTTTTNSWSASSSFSEQNSDVISIAGSRNGGAKSESFKALSLGGSSVFQHNKSKQQDPVASSLSQVIHLSNGSSKSFMNASNKSGSAQCIEKPTKSSEMMIGEQRKKPQEFSQSSISALDADFQQKLAQAISRGFRIRSQIANGTVRKGATNSSGGNTNGSNNNNNHRRGAILRRPQSVALPGISDSNFRQLHHHHQQQQQQQQTMRTPNHLQRELSTFVPLNRNHNVTHNKFATGKDNTGTTINERLKSHDLSRIMNDLNHTSNNRAVGSPSASAARLTELPLHQHQFNINVGANLNEIILMKQRLLSKSQSQIDVVKSGAPHTLATTEDITNNNSS